MSAVNSRNHSPSRSPTNTQSQRLINGGTSYAVGGGINGLKSLNSGWQVWGGGHSRNTPGSSVTSAHEISPPRSDANQRGSLTDWTSLSRPTTSRSWDDVHDHVKLDTVTKRQTPIGQSGVLSIPRIEQTLILKNGLVSANSPTRATYAGYQKSPVTPSFDSLQTASRPSTMDELSSGMRGMVVEDEHDLQRQAALNLSRNHLPPSNGLSYASIAQPDYNSPYQASQGPRDTFSDSPFSYDPYRPNSDPPAYSSPAIMNGTPPSIYPNISPLDPHRRPGFVYDYPTNPRPPAPQFYYPSQGLVYGHPGPSPHATPQIIQPGNLSGAEKIDVQYPTGLPTPMLTPMTPLVPPHNGNFGPLDSASAHMVPFAAPHLPQFAPMTPVYSNGVFPYANNIRISTVVRSTLLEEFRTRKSRKWELNDIAGHIVEFSMDQYGSRFIQTKLENAGIEKIRAVYDEIVPTYALKLMQDVFGNYVIQKLMDFGTQDQRAGLARMVENDIVDLSLNVYGCRVVQKVIELCTTEQQTQLVRKIEPHVLTVVKDTNGNHVIQKFVMTVPPERLSFLRAFRDAARQLAIHPYGCRVLQRCLEYLPNDYCRGMIDELHGIADNLMQDQFGNYVIQYILQHGQPHDCVIVASQMKGLVLKMSRHKFASNVVEKILVHADHDTRRKLVNEILEMEHGVDPVHAMMMDAYGSKHKFGFP
ncbi:hypothetical protein NP233_g13012 [Leucocoprinus birnbaumii]|uniref:PUM-HD domain-containing protein n=1 Tax=Leucocoprinus birnbaumii TaxID=56174 RepID=A0AAD5VDN3_9AGAR|nr:hypothetical protein NP233_g13012 [Leucocoprinus birnbaumii]